MAHTIYSMMKIGSSSKRLLESLPAEFTKAQFKQARQEGFAEALCFETARERGFIRLVRTEPCTYSKEMDCYTDPVTGREFRGWYELCKAWSEELAEHFGVRWWSQLDGEMKKVEFEGVRNVFAVCPQQLAALG